MLENQLSSKLLSYFVKFFVDYILQLANRKYDYSEMLLLYYVYKAKVTRNSLKICLVAGRPSAPLRFVSLIPQG